MLFIALGFAFMTVFIALDAPAFAFMLFMAFITVAFMLVFFGLPFVVSKGKLFIDFVGPGGVGGDAFMLEAGDAKWLAKERRNFRGGDPYCIAESAKSVMNQSQSSL